MTPPLADLLATARMVALPMNTRFRGVDVREALLFEGPQGWAEFAAFPEYDDAEALAWWRSAASEPKVISSSLAGKSPVSRGAEIKEASSGMLVV